MRNRFFPLLVSVGLLFGVAICLQAQNAPKLRDESQAGRVDLKPRTLVSKKLDRVEDGPNGKTYVYKYRVEAEPTEKEMPRYAIDPQYRISYEQKGFQKNDTVTLISDNAESATDSNIWVYEVSYVGSGERKITFATTGSVVAPTFLTASGETRCSKCGCDMQNCSAHDFCDECRPGCPENGCPAECPGCSCSCHKTCSADCDCQKLEDPSLCPGPEGHNCAICNPCSQGGCSARCDGDGCTCLCHCKCAAGTCSPQSACGCESCASSCSCPCHRCGKSPGCPRDCTDSTCTCDCHGLCDKQGCSRHCDGEDGNCRCECHDTCDAP